jgi:trk system potassium uptake protein TrkH
MKVFEKLSTTKIIVISFLIVILIGTSLLSLPISQKAGTDVSFLDALFTATSSTCVTGLIVKDTFSTWTVFGQLVILSLIQIGGLGFMTLITMFFLFLKKKINFKERKVLVQSVGNLQYSGMTKLIKKIFLGTIIFESIGAVLLFFGFLPEFGVKKSIYFAIFHSISAFCNAGFDLMGIRESFSSFTGFVGNPLINLTLISLIIIGGLGFIVWQDMYQHKFNFKKYCLHSKIVLSTSFILVLFGTISIFAFEYNNTLSGMCFGEKLLASLFQAVTPRTAGFNTLNLAEMTGNSKLIMTILMLIGGGSGSTAGGIKITTFAILILTVMMAARHRKDITVFKKRIDNSMVIQAQSIFLIYMTLIIISVVILGVLEIHPMSTLLFETVSAIGTVGVTFGITSTLCTVSKIVIMILMFCGRIGGLSFMLFFAEKRKQVPLERPTESILIG